MIVDDCIMMEHFCIESGVFGKQPHKISEMSVGDIDHGSNRDDCFSRIHLFIDVAKLLFFLILFL